MMKNKTCSMALLACRIVKVSHPDGFQETLSIAELRDRYILTRSAMSRFSEQVEQLLAKSPKHRAQQSRHVAKRKRLEKWATARIPQCKKNLRELLRLRRIREFYSAAGQGN